MFVDYWLIGKPSKFQSQRGVEYRQIKVNISHHVYIEIDWKACIGNTNFGLLHPNLDRIHPNKSQTN